MKISRKIQKLTLAILLMLPSFSYAQETVLSFFPDSVNIELPEDFTVDIEIGNVESLYGFAGDIVYDPDILEVVTLDEGDFLNNGGSVPTAFFYDIDNVNGRVIVGLSILGSPGAYPSSANDTTLFSITFRSLTFGQDTLIFENTALFAPDGETQYPHETDTGLVIVSGEDQLVQLQLIPSDTTFENGDTLEVSFMISEASNVFSIALDIVYDPYLFQIDSMSFRQGNFLSEDHTVECQMLTDVHPEEGRAIIGIIRPDNEVPGASTIDPDTVVSFKVYAVSPGSDSLIAENIGIIAPDGYTTYDYELKNSYLAVRAGPVLSLSTHPLFNGVRAFYPSSGTDTTVFEFRVNYQDSANYWPQLGYPRLILDWNGDGDTLDSNDGVFAMNQSEADTVLEDGADYSFFMSMPYGGNPKIKFDAVSATGLYIEYPPYGWLNGPSIVDPNAVDLFIYANDITFEHESPIRPEVGEELTINARFNNNSYQDIEAVKVFFYIDEDLADSFLIDNIPARESYGPGFSSVSIDTFFNQIAFYDIRFVVDPHNEITEWNEYNNSALRALFVGDYVVPGEIHIEPYALGSYYPAATISGGGAAWYEAEGDSLEPLSGSPVIMKILEGNIALDTVYVNDFGIFYYSFQSPLNVGYYHLYIEITDYTLTDTVTVPFSVIPYPPDGGGGGGGGGGNPVAPNLIISFGLSGFPVTECGNNLQVVNPFVKNIGNDTSRASRAVISFEGNNLVDEIVPPLNPGQFHPLPGPPPLSFSESGYKTIMGIADFDNQVIELNEYDNYNPATFYVWCCPADLEAHSILLSGVAYAGREMTITSLIRNIGGEDALSFDFIVLDSSWAGINTIGSIEGNSLAGFGATLTQNMSYTFADTGAHKLTLNVDPGGFVNECSDDNNQYSRTVNISQPVVDLYTRYENIFVDDPDANEGDGVHFQSIIGNRGDSSAYNCPVRFMLNGEAYTATPDVIVPIIEAGDSALVQHDSVWIVDYGKCPLIVNANPDSTIHESNYGNNCDTVLTPYDLYPYYRSGCSGNIPRFFSVCQADTNEDVTINLTAMNSGLFNLNDTLRFNIYDSLAGADEMVLIDSVKIFEPLLHHNQNYIINGYAHRFAEYGTHFVTVVINPGHLIAECDFENNFSIYSILIRPVPPSKPDLVIHSEWIDLSELNPDYGDTFCITNVDVHNFGDTTAFDIEIKYEISGVQLGDIVVIDSIPKDGYFYTQPTECAVVDTCEPSLRIVRVCSDPFNLIEELIEDNNCATRSVFYCEAADLYVKDIFLVPSCNEVGQDVQIMAVIADSSEGDATYSALIDFYYLDGPQNNWRDTIYISTSGITDISAGTDSVTTYVNWTVALDSGYIYVDIADVYPNDYNPDNNTGSAYYACVPGCMYLAGDANMANEYVDIGNPLTGPWRVGGDVTFLVNYFDITSGNQPCLMHNPNNTDNYPGGPVNGYYFASADATGEGLVTGGDVSRLVAYFGGTAEIKWYGWDKPDPENYYPPLWLNNRGSGLEQPVPPLEELPEGWPNCQIPPPAVLRVLQSQTPQK